MKPLDTIYWLRLALGVVAAVASVSYAFLRGEITNTPPWDIYTLLNGMSLALVIYLISYYVIKWRFKLYVEKPQKLVTTGFGVYFLSWIVFWALFYSILAGPGTIVLNVVAGANGIVSPSGSQTLTVGQVYSFTATADPGFELDHWELDGTNQTANNPLSLTITFEMNNRTLTAVFTSQP